MADGEDDARGGSELGLVAGIDVFHSVSGGFSQAPSLGRTIIDTAADLH